MKLLKCNYFNNYNWSHPWILKDKEFIYAAVEKRNKAFVVACLSFTDYPVASDSEFPMLTLNLCNFRSKVIQYPTEMPDYEILKV